MNHQFSLPTSSVVKKIKPREWRTVGLVAIVAVYDQHFENGPGETIYPQIISHILICYKDICYSLNLFLLAILKQY